MMRTGFVVVSKGVRVAGSGNGEKALEARQGESVGFGLVGFGPGRWLSNGDCAPSLAQDRRFSMVFDYTGCAKLIREGHFARRFAVLGCKAALHAGSGS